MRVWAGYRDVQPRGGASRLILPSSVAWGAGVMRRVGVAVMVAVVTAAVWGSPEAGARAAGTAAVGQSDLDEFMRQVLAKRDENWKKLQQYVLDEREKVEVRGPAALPIWGQKREYQWFIREGYFVRSPITADGVKISEDDRRKYEEEFLRRAKARDKREADKQAKAGVTAGDPEPQVPAPTVDAILNQTRQPQFVDSAYFLRFKFEQGKYALVGRETFDDRQVLRIEYYPTKLFSNDRDEERRHSEERRQRDQNTEAQVQRLMNKNSLVTLWVEPASKQIVKYTFDNVQLDFLPAAWLLRMEDLKASMTMSQPFKDVWLPRGIEMYFSGLTALGTVDVRFNVDYYDYREATTSGRIKGRGLVPPAGPGPEGRRQ